MAPAMQLFRGVHRNSEKGFPPLLSDCYIRVVYNT